MSDDEEAMHQFHLMLSEGDLDNIRYLRYAGRFKSAADTIRACLRAWASDAKKWKDGPQNK